jgi:hypothetical protein
MSLSQRPRIQSLQRLARKAFIAPDPDTVYVPVTEPVAVDETPEERLINDMAIYWDYGSGKGMGSGSRGQVFPSVELTEIIVNQRSAQARARAILVRQREVLGAPGSYRTEPVRLATPYIAIPEIDGKLADAREEGKATFEVDRDGVVTALKSCEGLVTVTPRVNRPTFAHSGLEIPLATTDDPDDSV